MPTDPRPDPSEGPVAAEVLAEGKRLLDGATPGPWRVYPNGMGVMGPVAPVASDLHGGRSDAALIAWLRNNADTLIAAADGSLSSAPSDDPAPRAVVMVEQLRAALGKPNVADPRPPSAVWAEALEQVERLASPAPSGEGLTEALLDVYIDAVREALTCLNNGDVNAAVRHLLAASTSHPAPSPEGGQDLDVDFDVYSDTSPLPPFDPTLERTATATPPPTPSPEPRVTEENEDG